MSKICVPNWTLRWHNPAMASNLPKGRASVHPSKTATSRDGILVFGMHRSGTSAITRALNLSGASLGGRLVAESVGNETGHWENAFAVETNERLLATLGRGWDDARALPDNWTAHQAARQAVLAIRGYAERDLAVPLFALKDPRLCRLAPIWLEALNGPECRVCALIVLRHPLEIAASLAARDGFSLGRSLLLWLRHMLECEAATRHLPRCFVRYEQLLREGPAALQRIRADLSLDGLDADAAATAQIEAFLDAGRRHHVAGQDDRLRDLSPVAAAAHALLEQAADGADVGAALDAIHGRLNEWASLYDGLLDEQRQTVESLWQRTGRAEAALAGHAERIAGLPEQLERIAAQVADGEGRVLAALGDDIRRMQAEHQRLLAETSRLQADAALGSSLSPRIEVLTERVIQGNDRLLQAFGEDIHRMQAAQETLLAEATRLQADAALGSSMLPRIEALTERVIHGNDRLLQAFGEDIRRMQAEHARALSAAEQRGGELSESRAQVAALTAQLGQLSEALATHSASLSALQATSADREAVVHWLEERLGERDAELAQINHDLAARLDELAQRDSDLAKAQQAAASLESALAVQTRLRQRAEVAVQRVVASRLWRGTRPLRALLWAVRNLRRRLGGQPSLGAFHDDLDLVSPGAGGVASELNPAAHQSTDDAGAAGGKSPLAAITLAPEHDALPDVFVWGVIDWHFRYQRPQHIASALARKGHRVFYVSNNFIDSREPGVAVEPLNTQGRLFQVRLHVAGAPAIYFHQPDSHALEAISASLAELLDWTQSRRCISLVQHPYWRQPSRMPPNVVQVYDCMDHHAGFDNTGDQVIAAETALIADADLVVVSSQWLHDELSGKARNIQMVRNAADYAFFSRAPERICGDAEGRRVVGYYGAIAEWFDIALVRAVAQALPQTLIRLVGNDTAGAQAALADLDNVELTGEVPYTDLPQWLYGFDVCLLPFRVTPLTEATNPVKVYEYLSAGKPVVSVDLPELRQFGGQVSVAGDPADFIAAVSAALDHPGDAEAVEARRRFAAEQTWDHRAQQFDQALASIAEPRVSVVVLTYNNLAFTEACLFSIEHYSDYPNLEVIVVDNASSDGSPAFLRDWAGQDSPAGHTRRLILNDTNLGFAAGNNVGLAAADGEYLVMLNNDTYVTPGWVRSLIAPLRREADIGLVGPVTNNIGNEARVEIAYADMAGMIHAAREYTLRHPGQTIPLRTAAFFCVAMPRAVYRAVGGLDEAFGIGFFEDDDYCRRVEREGWRIVCAEDVFVHHHLSASFEKKDPAERQALFERNKAIYEEKWGAWQPHRYRES
jgi:GT2 family glycosyltransferase/glycosyltransferase involved in cell wall biosynthesis